MGHSKLVTISGFKSATVAMGKQTLNARRRSSASGHGRGSGAMRTPTVRKQRHPTTRPTTELVQPPQEEPFMWHYHDQQLDESNPSCPLSSKRTTENIQDMLMGGVSEYREFFRLEAECNPSIRRLVDAVSVSARNHRRMRLGFVEGSAYLEDSDSSDDEAEAAAAGAPGTASFGLCSRADRAWVQKHDKQLCFVTCLLARMYNMHTKCFMLYALSCVFLATGVQKSTWATFLSLGVVYNHDHVEKTLLELGRRRMEWPEGASKSIGFCVSDNCDYNVKIVFQHADRDGRHCQTVNYLYFPVTALPNGHVPELPSSGVCAHPRTSLVKSFWWLQPPHFHNVPRRRIHRPLARPGRGSVGGAGPDRAHP